MTSLVSIVAAWGKMTKMEIMMMMMMVGTLDGRLQEARRCRIGISMWLLEVLGLGLGLGIC